MLKITEKSSQSTGGFGCIQFGGLSAECFSVVVFLCQNCTDVVLYQEGFQVGSDHNLEE